MSGALRSPPSIRFQFSFEIANANIATDRKTNETLAVVSKKKENGIRLW